MDTRVLLMTGTDYPVPECQIVVHQPSIKEIGLIGQSDFFSGIQLLCLNKSMFVKDETDLSNTSNFQIFMTIMSQKEAVDKKFAVQQACSLFFPNYKVMFTPRTLVLVGNDNTTIQIDEENFDYLQKSIGEICCLKSGPMDQQSFNPANAQAKEIAEKLMRGRQRVAEERGEANMSIFVQYLSILSIGLSMPLSELTNLTMYQLYDLVERYMLHVNWDMDIRLRLAGGKPDSQPDNWMKNIH